jgi:hypothetical protein
MRLALVVLTVVLLFGCDRSPQEPPPPVSHNAPCRDQAWYMYRVAKKFQCPHPRQRMDSLNHDWALCRCEARR